MYGPVIQRTVVRILLIAITLATGPAAAQVDEQLTAKRRLFKSIGPGLRALHRSPSGKYYVLASPGGITMFDDSGKQLDVFGVPPPGPVTNKAGRSLIASAEDFDVDALDNLYIADRGYNLVNVFSSEGTSLRSIPVDIPLSVAALPEGEVAVTTLNGDHLITVYGLSGHVAREFGEFEDIATRRDLNRYLNLGHLGTDSLGHVYYGFTYLPEPLVRQYDRFGFSGERFEFTNLDAFSEARAARREINRQDKRADPPGLRPILTAFGVDPLNGDLWMCLHNTLLHFDKEGVRRSEYQIYTSDGARLEGTVILVEQNRLLIGADPLGIYEFARPDRKR